MKYRKLPIETELEEICRQQGAEAMKAARTALFLETARTKGFQLVTGILRGRELMHLTALKRGLGNSSEILGSLKEIEAVRLALEFLVPAPELTTVDWYDDGEEDFTVPPGAGGT